MEARALKQRLAHMTALVLGYLSTEVTRMKPGALSRHYPRRTAFTGSAILLL